MKRPQIEGRYSPGDPAAEISSECLMTEEMRQAGSQERMRAILKSFSIQMEKSYLDR